MTTFNVCNANYSIELYISIMVIIDQYNNHYEHNSSLTPMDSSCKKY